MALSMLQLQHTRVAVAAPAHLEASATVCKPFGVALPRRRLAIRKVQRSGPLRAAEEKVEVAAAPAAEESSEQEWVPVMLPEDLPKGVRKEIRVAGRNLLIFWYRNQIYCIAARSPAEGAYSEGFIKAKFTQDFCIECPSTGTLFSLKDGSIVSWYPNNSVLRLITPQDTCKPLELYPVKLSQEAIYVDVLGGTLGGAGAARTRGGSDTSLENNNVFYLEPKVYVEGEAAPGTVEPTQSSSIGSTVTALVATVAIGGVAAGGTAVGIYLESPLTVGLFWAFLLTGAAYFAYQYTQGGAKQQQ